MKYILTFIFLLIALFLQVAFLQLPFVLICLLVLAITIKEQWVFFVAFLMGILLDMLSFHLIGLSSLFFLLVLGVVFLYERKFEIQSFFFVGFSSFFSIFFSLLFFGSSFFLLQLVLGVLLSIALFGLLVFFSEHASQQSMTGMYE